MNRLLDSALKAEQLSAFLENRAGCLSEALAALAQAGVNIRAVSLADTSDFGILRLMVDDIGRAEASLKEKGFTVGRTYVVAVEIDDKPGSLEKVLKCVSGHGVNVEYMYVYARRSLDKAVMIFRFDKVDQAIESLRQCGLALVPAHELERF